MARRKMNTSLIADSTKRKYSKAELNQMQQQEQDINKAFNISNLEDITSSLNDIEQIYYKEIKNVLVNTGTFTKVDSITISQLSTIMFVLYEANNNIRKNGILVDGVKNQALQIVKEYTILMNTMFKELSISISERKQLAQMTENGEFETADLRNLDTLINDFFREGA